MAAFLHRALDGTTPPDPEPLTWNEQVDALILDAGRLPAPEPKKSVTTYDAGADDFFEWRTETHDVVVHPSDLSNLGVADDVLWPGNLIRGDTAKQFVFEPIKAYRAPITLWVDLEGSSCAGALGHTVTNPTTARIKDGIRQLLQQARADGCLGVPAKAIWQYEHVYSKSQMDVFANADVSYGAYDLSAQFDWSKTVERDRIFAKYQQVFFAIYANQYVQPDEVFDAARMTPGQVAAAIPRGSLPLMVARVNYGFQAYLTMESEFSEETTSFALQAGFDDGVTDVDVETGLTAKEILQQSNIDIFVYGGATAGLDNIYSGYDGFVEFINASKDADEGAIGVPLSYQLRHLGDQTTAQIALTGQYAIRTQWPLDPVIRVTLDAIQMGGSISDEGASYIDCDRVHFRTTPTNRTTAVDPGVPAAPAVTMDDDWSGENHLSENERHDFTNLYTDIPYSNGFGWVPGAEGDWDFDLLDLYFYARDHDSWPNPDDSAAGTLTLTGDDIVGASGIKHHEFTITESADDWKMTFYYTTELRPAIP